MSGLAAVPLRELPGGVRIPLRPLTRAECRSVGIDPDGPVVVPIEFDAVDALGLVLLAVEDTFPAAVLRCITYAGHHMPPGWRPEGETAPESRVNGEVNGDGGAGNGVTVNPRTAQKWATVARVAGHFAANPGQTIREGARELGISERHVYRIVTENLGGKQ